MNISALFPRSYNLSCAVLEVIIKIEKSQNLHLLRSNLILCHLYTVNIAKFIFIFFSSSQRIKHSFYS